jgi:hypothetical protein
LGCAVYTDGAAETLLSSTVATANGTATLSSWQQLATPTGGWTWAKVQALEVRLWLQSGGSGSTSVSSVQIAVATDAGHSDIGAVESRNSPAQDTTIFNDGGSSAVFSGAGIMDFPISLTATATTISVAAYYDSNYVGSKPKLEVLGITGVADQSVSQTGAANAFETISVTFTPTADCVARIRLSSLDTSTNGKCYFDTLTAE